MRYKKHYPQMNADERRLVCLVLDSVFLSRISQSLMVLFGAFLKQYPIFIGVHLRNLRIKK